MPDVPGPIAKRLPSPRGVPLASPTSSPRPDALLLRGDRGGCPPSSTERLLASWSADELALFARVELLTGRGPSAEVLALVRQRREGAAPDALREAAMRALADDPLARAAALEWARTAERP